MKTIRIGPEKIVIDGNILQAHIIAFHNPGRISRTFLNRDIFHVHMLAAIKRDGEWPPIFFTEMHGGWTLIFQWDRIPKQLILPIDYAVATDAAMANTFGINQCSTIMLLSRQTFVKNIFRKLGNVRARDQHAAFG